jgi:hypothetical protein
VFYSVIADASPWARLREALARHALGRVSSSALKKKHLKIKKEIK